jgi:hypothetical protein
MTAIQATTPLLVIKLETAALMVMAMKVAALVHTLVRDKLGVVQSFSIPFQGKLYLAVRL